MRSSAYLTAIFQLINVYRMSIRFIDQQDEFDSILPNLKGSDKLAIDLEFDKNYFRYGFNLCLMQIYDGKTCFLIDPQSNELSIETVFPVLEDESILKVSFAFGEDLRLLHSLGCFPSNIYDLDFAISLLNYEPASLANHLSRILGIETENSSQLSNWYDRPLSDKQVQYAADDVLHLLKLHQKLNREAAQKGVQEWINQENRALTAEDFSTLENSNHLKQKNRKEFSETGWHIYTRLIEAREQLAANLNKPSFKVIRKEVLMEIARSPGKLQNWEKTRGVHKRLRNKKIREKLQDILQEAREEAAEKGLSETESAEEKLSREEKQRIQEQRANINRAKNELFKPMKELIEEDYGKEVSTFLFSNRIIGEIVVSGMPGLLPYKKEILHGYAQQLNIPVENYLDT